MCGGAAATAEGGVLCTLQGGPGHCRYPVPGQLGHCRYLVLVQIDIPRYSGIPAV